MDKATAAYFRMNAAKQMKGKKNMSELGNVTEKCRWQTLDNFSVNNFYKWLPILSSVSLWLKLSSTWSQWISALVTTKLKLAEKSKIIYEEQPNYTKEELLADIGGALGLFLGLNLLDVLLFLGQILKVIIMKTLVAFARIKVA